MLHCAAQVKFAVGHGDLEMKNWPLVLLLARSPLTVQAKKLAAGTARPISTMRWRSWLAAWKAKRRELTNLISQFV